MSRSLPTARPAQTVTKAAPAQAPQPAATLLDAVIAAGVGPAARNFGRFLSTRSSAVALAAWLGPDFDFSGPPEAVQGRITRRLARDLSRLDQMINRQVNAVLHHPEFQKLEAGWRGLKFLTDTAPPGETVKVMVLNVNLPEVRDDLLYAIEFDQSTLFRRIYGDHYDMAGAAPISLLIGNYEFTNHPTDVDTLEKIAGIAAAAFAPFIAAAHPELLDLDHFGQLASPPNLAATFSGKNYIKWEALRQSPDSRFVGLTLPHILLRDPYRDDNHRADGFRFREEVGKPDNSEYLWGNAAFAFGAATIRAFAQTGWLADIRGYRPGELSGGVVAGLPACSFRTDRPGLAPRPSTDVIITDMLERDLGELGFLPLCWCQNTNLSAFHSTQSIQKPLAYDRTEATVNAKISSMLHYILCASRFAHFLKVRIRNKIGNFTTPDQIEDYLRTRLLEYVNSGGEKAAEELKAKFPLRDASVHVSEMPGEPGRYKTEILLRPQFQLDSLVGSIHLDTELRAVR